MVTPKVYELAVCLYNGVTMLDYQGPVEILCFWSDQVREMNKNMGGQMTDPACTVKPTFLAHTMEPVHPTAGPAVVPTGTYDDAKKQFDFIMIPGGPTGDHKDDAPLMNFLKRQAPGAQHILTICTGSWILSSSGLLDGQRATTNKAMYKQIETATKDRPITWVPNARWVTSDDTKIWSSSGIAAGIDLGHAFLSYLSSEKAADDTTDFLEMTINGQAEDPFSSKYGLV